MGGRGASVGGSIPEDDRHWERISSDSESGRPNEIDGVKILRFKDAPNAHIPVESNTPNTSYIIADEEGKISYITIYENNHITMSIDILKDGTSHMHKWEDGKRKRHKKSNDHATPEEYEELARKCAEYNEKYINKK